MNNIYFLKKKILHRCGYRGIKEMDLLLGSFVKKYINSFNLIELNQLDYLLGIDDDDLFKWYLNRKNKIKIPKNRQSKKSSIGALSRAAGADEGTP